MLFSENNCSTQDLTGQAAIRQHVGVGTKVKLNNSVSAAVRNFAYFMSSGTHVLLDGIEYLELYGNEPSAIEQAYAIFMNVLELDENGAVINLRHAEKRATDYIRSYCDPNF